MNLYPSGVRIAGRYEVAGAPILGGMGIVYFCFDHEEQRPVALKTFRPEYLLDWDARERFLQEGEAWVRLGKHPHIVRCYRVFRESKRPAVFLVLELIAKEKGLRDASLRAWLTAGRPLPMEQALLMALQIARGMQHATQVIPGFIHRDLKPENVLVGTDWLSNAAINRVRVTDFGLVKGLWGEQGPEARTADLARSPSRLTRIGSVMGTPSYMAPEQWESPNVTILADIYAFGCIVGEMVTGRMLVQGHTLDALRQAHQSGQALIALRTAPTVLAEFLGHCLAVDQTQRYADWSAVEEALAATYSLILGQPPPSPESASALSQAEQVVAGWSYEALGESYLIMGSAQAALGYFQWAYQVGQAEKERRLEAAGLGNLGCAHLRLGDVRQAIGYCEQDLAISRQINDRRSEGCALGNLGLAYARLGDTQTAIRYHMDALSIDEELRDRQGEMADLHNLGSCHKRQGNAGQAKRCFERALAIAREIGDRTAECEMLGGLGQVHMDLEDLPRSQEAFMASLQLAQEIGERHVEAQSLIGLGSFYGRAGSIEQAIKCYRLALDLAPTIDDPRVKGSALGGLGHAYVSLEQPSEAIEYLSQALGIFRGLEDRPGEADSLSSLGTAYAMLDDGIGQAIQCLEQAIGIYRGMGDRRGEGKVLLGLSCIHLALGRDERAFQVAKEAVVIFEEIGDIESAALMHFSLSMILFQWSRPEEALPHAARSVQLFALLAHPWLRQAQMLLEQIRSSLR